MTPGDRWLRNEKVAAAAFFVTIDFHAQVSCAAGTGIANTDMENVCMANIGMDNIVMANFCWRIFSCRIEPERLGGRDGEKMQAKKNRPKGRFF